MEPILTIDNLNSFGGNMLRQGDKSQLKYRLRDVGNKNLGISGKSCQVKMYGRNYTTVVYETTTTVSSDNSVTFTIDKILPKGTFYLEFTVGDYIFPTDHREYFEITPSGKAIDANIIEIVGKDVLIRDVRQQVETGLQPIIDDLTGAEDDRVSAENARQQNESNRNTAESSRVSAEEQRKADHANRSVEMDGKADKVVIENLVTNGDFSDGLNSWGIYGSAQANSTRELAENPVSSDGYSVKIYRDNDQTGGFGRMQSFNFDKSSVLYIRVGMLRLSTDGLTSNKPSISIENPLLHFVGESDIYDTWQYVSDVFNKTTPDVPLHFNLAPDNSSGGLNTYFDNVMLINLTETFGAGNEPTKEEMDELIEIIGYIDGEYALNNKEMLDYLMKGIRGKADKVVLKNLIENGNFNDGLTGWASFRGESVLEGGKALVTADGSGNFAQVHRNFAFSQVKGHKYYGASSVRLLNSDVTEIRLMVLGNNLIGKISNPEQDIDYLLSGIETAPTDNSPQAFIPRIMYPSDEIANGKQHIVNFALALDLTEIFGAGNEPTKEEMDELVNAIGYIDGEYALNNTEMLEYLMDGIHEKANKKQEDWITPTLLNGWVHHPDRPFQYRKDNFGQVIFKGHIENGTSNNVCILPGGEYRPKNMPIFSTLDTLNNSVVQLRVYTTGYVQINNNSSSITSVPMDVVRYYLD